MSKFKVGDKVRCISDLSKPFFTKGEEILIERVGDSDIYGRGEFYYNEDSWHIDFDRIELVESAEKSRVKEIEVYVKDKALQSYLKGDNLYDLNIFTKEEVESHEVGYLKAKLIVELPEKKVELSESEFDKALSRLSEHRVSYEFEEALRKEIFRE